MNVPKELRYTPSHEWVRVEGEIATIGITDYAQSELGDVVYVDVPSPGRVLRAGESLGSIESVKTVSEIYAPVDGEVVEANAALGARSELVNEDPYGKGFLVKIKMANADSVGNLLTPEAYSALES